jgi:hypothetical protein
LLGNGHDDPLQDGGQLPDAYRRSPPRLSGRRVENLLLAGLTAPQRKRPRLREWRRSLLEAQSVLAENRPCLPTEINTTEMAENVIKSRRIVEKINKYA